MDETPRLALFSPIPVADRVSSGTCGQPVTVQTESQCLSFSSSSPSQRTEYNQEANHVARTLPNGEKYVGGWKNGKKNGQGTYTWPNGEEYEGGWKDGKQHGTGKYVYANGETYEGDFRDDRKCGHGTYTWPNGEEFVGKFRDDKPNGDGTHTCPDGTKYVGEWKDGKPNGYGVFLRPDGMNYLGQWKYVGRWKDGKLDGYGTYTWPNGEKYEGEFRDDKKNGNGTLTLRNGTVQKGIWQDDALIIEPEQRSPPRRLGDSLPIARSCGTLNLPGEAVGYEVYVDGSFVGEMPAKLRLLEGSHTIEIQKGGNRVYKRLVTVSDGSEATLRPVLETH